MGPQRDVGKKDKKDLSEDWKSESVCKSHLVAGLILNLQEDLKFWAMKSSKFANTVLPVLS